MKRTRFILLTTITSLSIKCGIYNHTSGFEVHSISVTRIQNNIKTHSATIDYEITQKLEEKLNQQADLELVGKDGDLKMSGSITDYFVKPISIGANEKAYLNRVTIKLQIKLINQLEQNKITNKNISAFVDYNAQHNFGDVKDSLNNILAIKVAEEIYNQFYRSW